MYGTLAKLQEAVDKGEVKKYFKNGLPFYQWDEHCVEDRYGWGKEQSSKGTKKVTAQQALEFNGQVQSLKWDFVLSAADGRQLSALANGEDDAKVPEKLLAKLKKAVDASEIAHKKASSVYNNMKTSTPTAKEAKNKLRSTLQEFVFFGIPCVSHPERII